MKSSAALWGSHFSINIRTVNKEGSRTSEGPNERRKREITQEYNVLS